MRRRILLAVLLGCWCRQGCPGHSGKCLDVTSASTADNAALIQYTCSGATNQQWSLPAA